MRLPTRPPAAVNLRETLPNFAPAFLGVWPSIATVRAAEGSSGLLMDGREASFRRKSLPALLPLHSRNQLPPPASIPVGVAIHFEAGRGLFVRQKTEACTSRGMGEWPHCARGRLPGAPCHRRRRFFDSPLGALQEMMGGAAKALLEALEVFATIDNQIAWIVDIASSRHPMAPAAMAALLQSGVVDVNEDVEGEGYESSSCLHVAAHGGSAAMVKVLLDSGAYVDWSTCGDLSLGKTPLHVVCGPDSAEITRLLLASGASVDAGEDEDSDAEDYGYGYDFLNCTPLLYVASSGCPFVCGPLKILVDAGSDITYCNIRGMSVLHCLVHNPPFDEVVLTAVKYLVNAGADLLALDSERRQPLDFAFDKYNPGSKPDGLMPSYFALLEAGADPLAMNPMTKKCPLERALEREDLRNDADFLRDVFRALERMHIPRASDVIRVMRNVVQMCHSLLPPVLLTTFLASYCAVLTDKEWCMLSCLVHAPCIPDSGRYLSFALNCSFDAAEQFVCSFVGAADRERLQTFALCLHRLQNTPKHPAASLPADIRSRILAVCLSDV